MFNPSNLTHETCSIAFPLMIIGLKSAGVFANEIRISLHFFSFSWNLFLPDFVTSSLTSSWILLAWFFATFSAIVVSSKYFHSSVLVTSISSTIKTKSHGPSLVPWGTPAGISPHSDLQSCPSLTLCLRFLR